MARVLLVDDAPKLPATVGAALTAAGHEVVTADNGADALCRIAEPTPFDVLVLDLAMPVHPDGRDVIKALAPDAPPVIVTTGMDVEPGSFPGGHVKRVILKPYETADLIAAIADVLGGSP